MSRIRSLPLDLQNKIAAGEVIERPASVVKELLENGLDAAARHIEVHIQEGGRKLIKIVDDGAGIAFDDLPLALAPHATSKLQREDDLYHIQTMGFRGEALASIASISQLSLTSRPADASTGGRIVAEGGSFSEPSPCGCGPGTTTEVRNLFFNTPARRKFMKTPATEISHITEQVARIALARPDVSFKVFHNGKSVYDLPAVQTYRERISSFFGPELAQALISVERKSEAVGMYGLVSRPVDAKSSPRWQYIWLNGRYIRDRFIQHAVREAYRGLMDPNRQPVLFLYVQADPQDVDVNVHPTKIEVRWTDSGIVHGLALSTLREALMLHDNTPALQVGASQSSTVSGDPGTAPQQRIRQAIADFFKETGPTLHQQQHLGYARRSGPSACGAGSAAPNYSPRAPSLLPVARAPQSEPSSYSSVTSESTEEPVGAPVDLLPRRAIQVHNSYIVAETADGMVVVDQHALHERVLYEQLRARVVSGPLESQRMLLPETVNCPPDQVALAADRSQMLATLGIEAVPFGPNTIAVQAFPSIVIGRVRIDEFMTEMLSKLGTAASDTNPEKLLDEVLNMMACKAAVKAGDTLTSQEIDALLANWKHVEGSSNCPHGRPTVLRLTLADLEKQFHRT